MSSDTQKPIDEEPQPNPGAADADAAETGAEDGVSALLAQINQLQEDLAAQKDRTLRAVADLDNYRRRVSREKDDLRKNVESGVIEDLLPALDNFQMGLDHAAKASSAADVAKGFEFIVSQISQILEQRGLVQVMPKIGDEFDHHQHDAVGHEASDETPDHHILKVMRVGYQLHDRLLRPASVVVSSGPAKAGETAPES
ncbi:nucleotide exchange factor GrpE [Cerasicoccus arenae]|uniref:Protein GrpE n=1 Tax=Cerasicoccus arenae TaxID=424488 RepID=A0A8J3GF89_9BACT|nr:nucleotide exchange factor GrpE [Cerasicoccus arenae]MBK1858807.1 nucleotide exchange factor GrpE [Cerasicoccus arenae]GHC04480.1 protein GrpE [Cerasicoccus arenae]